MKRKASTLHSLIPLATVGILTVSAQTGTLSRLGNAAESKNRLSASFRAAFNVTTEFQNLGAFSSLGGVQLTPTGDVYNYDDGYVLVDSTGNALGYTRYWGYNYDSGTFNQVPGDGTILMSDYSSSGTAAEGDEEVLPGLEINYRRELGLGQRWRWGIETAANYMRVSSSQSGTLNFSFNRASDIYQLPPLEGGGVVTPPPAPYQGGPNLSPQGNPVIVADPIGSSVQTYQSTVTSSQNFDANVVGWKLGPYADFMLSPRARITLSGGLALAYVGSEFDFNQSVAISDVAPLASGGTDNDLVLGAYLAGEVSYRVADKWEVFGAVQFQYLEDYTHEESGRAVLLDMSQAIFVSVGAAFTF
jgi:hypothetical protein